MNKKETIEGIIQEEDFTVDSVGRVVIVDNKELLEEISGGVKEAKSPLFDQLFDDEISWGDTVADNCGCTTGNSGTGNSGSTAW